MIEKGTLVVRTRDAHPSVETTLGTSKGDIWKTTHSGGNSAYYIGANGNMVNTSHFRLTTRREQLYFKYNPCIKNISEIPKINRYTVVKGKEKENFNWNATKDNPEVWGKKEYRFEHYPEKLYGKECIVESIMESQNKVYGLVNGNIEVCFRREALTELGDAPKVEKWSKGSYVVVTTEYHSVEVGDVYEIEGVDKEHEYIGISNQVGKACLPYFRCLKWFPTKEEAEAFSKELLGKDRLTYLPEKGCVKIDNVDETLAIFNALLKTGKYSTMNFANFKDYKYLCWGSMSVYLVKSSTSYTEYPSKEILNLLINKQSNQKQTQNGSNKNSSKEQDYDLQRVNQSIRETNRSRKPRFASTEGKISNRGGYRRNKKRSSFSQTTAF